jgi:hypothetical protein
MADGRSLNDFHCAAGGFDEFNGTDAESVRPHRQTPIESALSEHLDLAALLDEAGLAHFVGADGGTLREALEPLDVDDGIFDLVAVLEALELGEPPVLPP